MTKTDYINKKSLQAMNRLKLPDYSGRYKRLRSIAESTGRIRTGELWQAECEMWAEDLLMLKL